jgi:error-prone DNA polymerase
MKMRAPKGEGALAIDELDGVTSGLIALAGRPILDARRHGVGGMLDRLVGLFGRDRVYVELQRHLLRDEACDNEALTELARAYRVPIIATNGVRFATAGSARSSTSSAASITAPRSTPLAGCWRATLSAISNRPR